MIISSGLLLGQTREPSLDVQLLTTPVKVSMAGKPTVYYELVLTNLSSDSIELKSVEVIADGDVIHTLKQKTLADQFAVMSDVKPSTPTLAPNASAIVYLELLLTKREQAIAHSIVFDILSRGATIESSMRVPSVKLSRTFPPIGPPLGKGNWAAVFDPEWERGHRRVIYTIGGRARIPGRFAIDFIMLDDEGRFATGDDDKITAWYGYSADVLAVTDGTVLSVRNDFPESDRISAHPDYPAEQATGNYVSIELKDGRTAFYEHLKPGSITVRPGQKVRKGDVIASLGFTGQTTGPHLHFHLADRNSALGAEGQPFTFEKYWLLGGYADFNNFGKKRWEQVKEAKMKGDVPASNSVIRFE